MFAAVLLTDPIWQLSEKSRQGDVVLLAVSTDSAPVFELEAEEGAAAAAAAPAAEEPAETLAAVEGPLAADAPPAEELEFIDVPLAELEPMGAPQEEHIVAYLVASAPERERALGLTPPERRAVQRRLSMLGYDPKGIDGVFGPGTRTAISEWQSAFGFEPTGYIDAEGLASLEERTVELWAAWEAERPKGVQRRIASVKNAPVTAELPSDRATCVRGRDGRILDDQGLSCDLRSVKEGLARFFGEAEGTMRTKSLQELEEVSGGDR